MKRTILALSLALAGWSGMGLAAHPVFAASICVGSGIVCFSTIQAALDAAHDGDVIHIGQGTFAGGVTIDKSVSLVGAGPSATIIRGGGSVLMLGTLGASSEPTVSIVGVTITGGVARSSPESESPNFVGTAGVMAMGGGIEIPPNADFTGGATVSISNSVITGNRVAPTTTLDIGPPCPPDITFVCHGRLPFAGAYGGGIDNWGTLTVTNTTISDNLVGAAAGFPSVASDAHAGAIQNWLSSLTISNSIISGNRASAAAPNGRFADTGGVFLQGGTLNMSNSTVTNNQANLAAAMPSDVQDGTLAIAGGVHIGGGTAATIRNTIIAHNSISATNTVGDATAFSGGLHTDVYVALSSDVIANNSVSSATLPGSTGNAEGDSGAGEGQGTMDNTRLTGNTVTVNSVAGSATASAGAAVYTGTMTNGVVSGNSVHASSASGAVLGVGGALLTGGALTLRNTTVSDNSIDARGSTGSAQGGGIFAVDLSPNGPPGGPLVLSNSRVTGNALSGSAGISLQGGGLYVTDPLTMTNSKISGNVPDNCFGSSC